MCGKCVTISPPGNGTCPALCVVFLDYLMIDSILSSFNPYQEIWPWGGEPIYRDGLYTGLTTCSSYGPSIGKMICLGWVTNPDPVTGQLQILDNNFVPKGKYEINIAGKKVSAKASLFPSKLSTKQPLHGWKSNLLIYEQWSVVAHRQKYNNNDLSKKGPKSGPSHRTIADIGSQLLCAQGKSALVLKRKDWTIR